MKPGKMFLLAGFAAIGMVLAINGTAQAHPSKCSSCHVPHKAGVLGDGSQVSYGVPLWNPTWGTNHTTGIMLPVPTFTLYTSTKFDALGTGIGQPDGPSKLCLGCHDGSYISPTSNHAFGDDKKMTLTESHPISFVYDSTLASDPRVHLKNPEVALSGLTASGTITHDLLDTQGKVQCTSCHDIHSSNTTANAAIGTWGGTTLRFSYTADNGLSMCRTCHNK